MHRKKQSKFTATKITITGIPKTLILLALEARKYKSADKFVETLGIPEKNIVWIKVFGSSVEGKAKPRDIDIFIAVKDSSMKFKKSRGLYRPIIKEVGRLNYFIMPEVEAENLLNAMLYTGRKDPNRAYKGKTIKIKSLRDFYIKVTRKNPLS